MLACARIGAPHTVVFGGFSADALATRVVDCGVKVIITADGGYRRGAPVGAQAGRRRGLREDQERRPHRREGAGGQAHRPGRRLGRRASTSGGTTPSDQASSRARVRVLRLRAPALRHVHLRLDRQAQGHPAHDRRLPDRRGVHALGGLRPQAGDRRLLVHRRRRLGHRPQLPRLRPARQRPPPASSTRARRTRPRRAAGGRSSQDYKVSIFYTAPTAIRSFMKQGQEIPDKYDMSSLRVLGSVGEPINPEAYVWYRHVIGGDRTPVVDTWWQTETGAIMISPLPGVTARQAGLGDDPDPRRLRRRGHRGGRVGPQRLRRLPRAHRAVALDAAHHLGRRRPVPGDLLVEVQEAGLVLRRRRRQEGRATATCGCSAGSTTS